MALQERNLISYEIDGSGFKHIFEIAKVQIYDDSTGEVKSTSPPHRRPITCASDVSKESSEIQAIANAVWTPEVVSAWEVFLSNNN